MSGIDQSPDGNLVWFLSGLAPIRILEWGVLLRIFFEPAILRSPRACRYAALATVWSYVLDAIAIMFAVATPGGRWIC